MRPQSLVRWNDQYWGLPIAQATNVIYYNKALLGATPIPTDLASFVALATASPCNHRMVLSLDLLNLGGFFLGSTMFPAADTCSAGVGIQDVFGLLHSLARSSCTVVSSTASPNSDFESGLATFYNGHSSQLGQFESALGANLGIVGFPRLTSQIDTRQGLEAIVIYANAHNKRQAAIDWSAFAASRGQAGVWQNLGRLPSVRADIPQTTFAQNTEAMRILASAAWPVPSTTEFWSGLNGFPGFWRAFSPG